MSELPFAEPSNRDDHADYLTATETRPLVW
jgi:hypothetical protein